MLRMYRAVKAWRSFSSLVFEADPVAIETIKYALSLSPSPKSTEASHAEALLVLEHCHSSQPHPHSKAAALLSISTLLSQTGIFDEAIQKLHSLLSLNPSSLPLSVAATEALVGLYLQLGNDESALLLANQGVQLFQDIELDQATHPALKALDARAKAVKGLVQFIQGDVHSANSCFEEVQHSGCCVGNVALSYGEFLHGTRKFDKAKELYQKVIKSIPETKEFGDAHNLDACNMIKEEVLLAATCGLGQLEAHLGNFGDAEEMLTTALKEAEEYWGSHHPKVGVVLTCIALMYRCKAMVERSSSLLIQEGLYRKALELLKAPPLETEGSGTNIPIGAMLRSDVVALARGGYAEVLSVQQNRRAEGEKMKRWAESAWRNRRLSLANALELSETSPNISVLDCRTSRAL